MDVRAGPIEPIDDTNNPCELPGAIITSHHRTSDWGELPDISARISETIAAMVTPTVAPQELKRSG